MGVVWIAVIQRVALAAIFPSLRKVPGRRAHRIRAAWLAGRSTERITQDGFVTFP